MIDRIMVRIFSGILFFVIFTTLEAQNQGIAKADSLFAKQQYTQALDRYKEIYDAGEASSSMLLKMAFIHDGLSDYPKALFFLDKYYQASADRNVVSKIEELSEANELTGYRYDDTHYFSALLDKFRSHILFLLFAISVLLLVYIVKKRKIEERPFSASLILLLVLLLTLTINNYSGEEKGIIMSDNTLLRSGPSAGAEPLEIITKGHKVKVLSRNDVWTKVIWDGQEVYVRNSRLQII